MWSGGSVINLGLLAGDPDSEAHGINDVGQVVGSIGTWYAAEWNPSDPIAASAVPEPSTWAMMLIGFAGLGFAGYRRAKRAARRSSRSSKCASAPARRRVSPSASNASAAAGRDVIAWLG